MPARGPEGSTPIRRRPRRRVSTGPRSEVAAAGGVPLRRVERFKRTPAYRGAVRVAYKTQPVKSRVAYVRQGSMTPERQSIIHTHTAEVARNKVLAAGRAQSTGFPEQDKLRVARFQRTDALSKSNQDRVYAAALGAARRQRRFLPGTNPSLNAITAYGSIAAAKKAVDTGEVKLGRGGLGDQPVKPPDTIAKERAMTKIAVDAAKAGASEKDITKALTAMDKRHKSPALSILEQFNRPISGVAGGVKGGPAGMVKGLVSNKESFTKILKDAGYSKGVTLGGGLVLDIALDPTTYLTLGTGRPALVAARKAAELAAKDALARGVERAAAERIAHQAAERTFAEHGAKGVGLKVGLRGTPVRVASAAKRAVKGEALDTSVREVSSAPLQHLTSRLVGNPTAKVTGAVSKRLPEKLRRDLDEIGQSLLHNYRPRGFSPVQWDRMRSAAREYRAGITRAERTGEARLHAYRKVLSDAGVPAERHREIIDAVEVRDVERLPKEEQPIAAAMLRDAESMAKAETKAGVRAPDQVVRERSAGTFPSPDIKASRKDLQKTRRAAATAEREVRKAEEDIARAQGRSEILSRNVGGRKAEIAAMRAYREDRIPLAPKSGEKPPPVPPGHVRLYRGEGVVRWSREDWPDAPQGIDDLSHGRWFTEDPQRAKGYATSSGRKGYVRYIDVPEDVAHTHRVPGEKSTFVLPGDVAKGAAELEPGAGRAAMYEHIKQTAAGSRSADVRARRRAAKEALTGKRAGGGVGVREAHGRLAAAEASRAEKLEQLAAKTADHTEKLALAKEARAARRRADQLSTEATGYVARYARGDLEPDQALRVYAREPGGRKVSSTSLRARREREPLAAQPEENRARLIQDIPTIMGERTAEGERLRSLATFNAKMAAHGKPLTKDDPIDLLVDGDTGLPDPVDMQRFYVVGERGDMTPVWRTVDRRDQLEKRIGELVDSGKEVIEVPRTSVEAMWNLAKRGRVTQTGRTATGNAIGLAWDEGTRRWKWMVTQPNPGYHARNLMGDAWNARLGGATLRDVQGALRSITRHRRHLDGLSKDMLRGIAEEPTVEHLKSIGKVERFGTKTYSDAEVMVLAEQHGAVRSGQVASELRNMRRGTTVRERSRPGQALQNFSESREDLMRLASFRRALKRGETPEAAAEWANKHHFDYADLTHFEVNALRRLIPFYTFMARNTPLQLLSLVRSPGRFATLEKTRNATSDAAGLPPDWAETMPEYVQASVPFAMPGFLPGSKSQGLPMLASPMLPVTDLNNITPHAALARLEQSITPFLKLPLEYRMKYDFFYRDKIRKDLVPAPSYVASPQWQANARRLVGALPGVGKPTFDYITDRRTGKRVIAWPWWMDKLAKQTPISGVVTGAMTAGRERRPGDRLTSLANWATGVRRQAISPSEARTSQLFEDLKNVEDEIALAKQRRTAKPGSPYAGKLKALSNQRSAIQQQLNLATTDFSAPYFSQPKRKRKAVKFGQAGGGPKFGSGSFGGAKSAKFGSGSFGG